MDILNKHSRWDKMIDNTLYPIKFNSLNNPIYKRNARDRIPKIIHQVWLKDNVFPSKISHLQNSVKIANKGYKYKLWTK